MAAARPLSRTYLDYNATAPLRPEAREAALAAMETTGNPSSVHAEGRAARRIVEDARSDVARLVGVASRCVTFVSGGDRGRERGPQSAVRRRAGRSAARAAYRLRRRACLCVLSGHRFPAAEIAPLRPDGRLDLDWLEAACRRPGRALLALQGANNETGVVQPVAEAAALVHAAGGLVFCDAVQMAGRMDCDIAALGADALMLSAHKIGGMKGAGALVTARAGISLGRAARAGRRPGARPSGGHRSGGGDRGLRRGRARVPA